MFVGAQSAEMEVVWESLWRVLGVVSEFHSLEGAGESGPARWDGEAVSALWSNVLLCASLEDKQSSQPPMPFAGGMSAVVKWTMLQAGVSEPSHAPRLAPV